jgi:photosystem I subunit 11
MSKYNFVGPYGNDSSVGHLSTPVSNSMLTRTLLENLPIYREGLTNTLRGLEVGMAHGYFLIGPFYKLGPLRNSDVALLVGYLSTIGLIIILTLALKLYGITTWQEEYYPDGPLESRTGWNDFTGGFFIGALGGAGFAFLLLLGSS